MTSKIDAFLGSKVQLTAFEKFIQQAEGDFDFWDIDEILASLNVTDTYLYYYVDKDPNDMKGMILFRISANLAELFYLYVLPNYRNQRIAYILLDSTLKYLHNRPAIERFVLEVRPSNRAAIHLYEKYGFELRGIRKRYYANNEDAWILEKDM